ncbi:DUF655 domain-containing protein [Candidatus Woesearchaeota archaeon]|nr:DUF655 domain-containing protein [Candidatus Woesearchaeota archaeon]
MAPKEEYAIILDFLQHGYPFDDRPAHKKNSIAQAIGINFLGLLELVPKKDIFLQPNEKVYIGEGKREKIHHISGRLKLSELTETAKTEVEIIIKELIEENEIKFIEFFNKAGPINMRRHQIELLPGFGNKHMLQILEERENKIFEKFDEMKERIKLLPDPKQAIIKRILIEMEGEEKYYLFVK